VAVKLDDDTIGQIIALRLDGLGPVAITRKLGIGKNSVYRYLTEAGLHTVTKAGAQMKSKCWRGHDLSKHSRERYDRKGGTRFCVKCKRINDRERRRRKYWEDKGMPEMYIPDDSDTRKRKKTNGREVHQVSG
jgi:hypothetical protein